MLAGHKGPIMASNQRTLGVCACSYKHFDFESLLFLDSGIRRVLQRKFIDCNTLCLLYQGKLCDNVCVYESVNICVWQ